MVSDQGMTTDPEKVSKVKDWPQPRTAKDLSSFLGLCSYFRKYVKNFASMAAPLFRLTSKDVPVITGCGRGFCELEESSDRGPGHKLSQVWRWRGKVHARL